MFGWFLLLVLLIFYQNLFYLKWYFVQTVLLYIRSLKAVLLLELPLTRALYGSDFS